ncbi:UDP-N-acetylglucosamine 2-epimerase (non-hydrolyzing) [Nitrosopumilus oxyclinae]|uniref:UDP-N-acetylglucosamine 2-epimerase (Non-hydrolyzing) n=1 Tax=Nitrosopumilus oxyclinae TaxID=1959104 RepID=A0A7D5R9P3_9ARCH|nr:UDP-N-acetylglucosamine 2-epimerase (non-hydrolyzing) [Nitrosopumilus oxyclinae]QLH04001.1 UDP-N-acetylglucosamine 2-epimerase (non-hydrolyzing) [Nitrosopumilus oxyclinae]
MKVAIVLGTRPEIIKLAPIIRKIGSKNCSFVFTGQHYDNKMGMSFIHELGLQKPNYSLNITKSNPSLQISEIIAKLSKILLKEKPDTVMIQGDTNTVLAAGICSLKSNIPISHVESGLRSNDWRMPEEHNRIAVDHISELLFAPTQNTKLNLKSEKVHGKIFVTGNTVIDAINIYSKISKKKSKISIPSSDFILLTLHRSENVDNKKILSSIIKGLIDSNENIIFPIHPRTKRRLHEFGLFNKLYQNKNIQILDTVGYFEILELMKNCSFIVTDSGGIQEEATSPMIRKKVLVVRKTTDRPEAVENKMAEIIGLDYKNISNLIKKTMKNPKLHSRKTPYGKGDASEKILKILKRNF